MTLEELIAAFEAHKKKSGAALQALEDENATRADEIGRLRGANKALLSDLKKAKVKVGRAQTDDEDDPAEDDGVPTAKPAKGSVADEVAKLKAQLEASNAKLAKKAIDAALSSALDAAKVSAQHRKAVSAMLRGEMEFALDDDGNVTVGDKPVADAINTWAKSDDGKAYVTAPASGGSGASGTKGAPASADMTGKRKADFSIAQRGRYVRENGAEAWSALPA